MKDMGLTMQLFPYVIGLSIAQVHILDDVSPQQFVAPIRCISITTDHRPKKISFSFVLHE